MRGLIDSGSELDLKCIARWYRDWYGSKPFDIGNTTYKAMHQLTKT